MKRILASVLMSLLLPALAFAHPYFTNEPASGERIVDCGFLTHLCTGQYTNGVVFVNGTSGNIVSDAAGPVSPPSAIQVTLNLATFFGNLEWFWWDTQPDVALYAGFTMTISPTYGVSLVGCSKIAHLRSKNQPFGNPETNGVVLFCGDGPTKEIRWSHNTSGLNNAHVCGGDAIGSTCFPNAGPGTFQRGVPVKIEVCQEASTTTVAQNGVLKIWVNGVLALNYSTLNYGGNNNNEFLFNAGWDGPSGLNGKGFSTETYQRFDHLILRRGARGMCSGSTAPVDTTPPSQVTSVTVTQLN